MDNLDRMYRHLVRTIRARFPQYLNQPFDVTELHQTILPYRHHRRELGLDTNEDYEITLTELLAGERGYLIVDDRMREVLKAELASANPDPDAFKQFAPARVALSPAALRSLAIGPAEDPASEPAVPITEILFDRSPAGAARAAPTAPRKSASTIVPSPSATPSAQPVVVSRSVVPKEGDRCRSCNEVLPPGRPIMFCPHCGQNLSTSHCPACGSELEVGWKFCPTCGRPAANINEP